MQHSKSSLLIKLAAIAAAVSVQGVALAASPVVTPDTAPAATAQQTPEASARDHKQKFSRHHDQARHGHHQRRHGEAALWVPGYGPIGEKAVAALELSADQKKLLSEAKSAQSEAQKERFDAMKAQKQARADQLKTGKLDPRAALKESGETLEKARAERSKTTDKWLAVWDSLNSDQQKKVAAYFGERAQKHADRMEKRAERTKAKQEKAAAKAPAAAQATNS